MSACCLQNQALTEDICSLRGDVERLTFSVLWEITPPSDNGAGVEVVNVTFSKVLGHFRFSRVDPFAKPEGCYGLMLTSLGSLRNPGLSADCRG